MTYSKLSLSVLLLSLATAWQLALAEPNETVAAQAAAAPTDPALALAESVPDAPVADEHGFYPGGPAYVSENASVWKRSGPSVNHGILAGKHVGDRLTFLRYSENGKFVEISDGDGKGWMQLKDVQAEPCGKALVEILQGQIEDLKHKFSNYDSELNRQYQTAQKRLEKLENENKGMKKAIEEKDLTIQQLDKQRRNYEDRLQTKELDMQMRWWLQGALIALGGAIIGIVFIYIPRPRRQKKHERF
ncbi:MAG: TIGR04211 family SH3 domain-containing protein [Succinivibrio sp.]|nr:TIGR04211 family SH3 domain-containing protein [Succinivibrio sp.]